MTEALSAAGARPAHGWNLLRTEGIAPGERLEFWRHATSTLFPPTQVRRASGEGFYGRISWQEFGRVTLADIVSTDIEVSRTEAQIASGDDWYEVNLQVEGTTAFAQGGRDVIARPRTMLLYDSRQPYRMLFEGHYRQLSLKVPRQALRDRVPGIDLLIARPIPAETLPGRFLYDFATTLCDLGQEGQAQAFAGRIEAHVIDLLATALSGLGEGVPLSAGRQAQLGRVKSHVLAQLDDPDLTPAAIAQAQQISLRSLYELFEGEPHQVAQWIKLQRLDRIRADLCDPLQQGLPITTIALKRGFKDFSHFSRAFRARYGISPRAFRKSQLH
ncbi:AraC-like ligand-binding domain-containing protein [Pseudooceanicola sp. 502str34]